eukprot:11218639-Lingulodinium_polyedra.AAC.1
MSRPPPGPRPPSNTLAFVGPRLRNRNFSRPPSRSRPVAPGVKASAGLFFRPCLRKRNLLNAAAVAQP